VYDNIGPDPLQAIQLINALSLYQSTFCPPKILASLPTHPASNLQSISAATILQILLTGSVSVLPPVHPLLLSNVTAPVKARLFLGASLTPFRNMHTEKESQIGVKTVIREGLKLGTQNHYLDGVPLLFRAAEILEKYDWREERLAVTPDRVKIGPSLIKKNLSDLTHATAAGLLLRDAVVHNSTTASHWTISLLFSLVQDLINVYDPQESLLNGACFGFWRACGS
jgi:tRNA nucleotidyltransferase (CCA-adding enzyme)